MQFETALKRHDDRIIIHFDYDCFYASVVEHEDPTLKALPLAIQQKQIIVTCNYEARRRGLYKLQLITDAKRICPEVIIVLGEDISRFRDASKLLYQFLQTKIWSGRAERLGFDEVWLDCTDMIDYNLELLNSNDPENSFFCMDKVDPTIGFTFDASTVYGPTFPTVDMASKEEPTLYRRLILGSHLARHLRHRLEEEQGYTATVGIATNKVLSKLIGNVNKPRNQTTLIPPYGVLHGADNAPMMFMDGHDIGKVPGIGFKLSQKIRQRVLGRKADFEEGLVYGGTKEAVTVRDARLFPGMEIELQNGLLSGPGAQKDIGRRIWKLMHGIDDTEVGRAKRVPSQISLEDSYIRLNTFEQVRREMIMLSISLLKRMHIDLTEDDDEVTDGEGQTAGRRWLAHPRTLRLSTRPRPPRNADGTRSRSFARISKSAPLPNFVFNLKEPDQSLAEKLVQSALIPMFRSLHPENSGWDLSLVNLAVTNMAETAAETKDSEGRDIGRMFKRQDDVLKDFRVTIAGDSSPQPILADAIGNLHGGFPEPPTISHEAEDAWEEAEEAEVSNQFCDVCKRAVPVFAYEAHSRFHDIDD